MEKNPPKCRLGNRATLDPRYSKTYVRQLLQRLLQELEYSPIGNGAFRYTLAPNSLSQPGRYHPHTSKEILERSLIIFSVLRQNERRWNQLAVLANNPPPIKKRALVPTMSWYARLETGLFFHATVLPCPLRQKPVKSELSAQSWQKWANVMAGFSRTAIRKISRSLSEQFIAFPPRIFWWNGNYLHPDTQHCIVQKKNRYGRLPSFRAVSFFPHSGLHLSHVLYNSWIDRSRELKILFRQPEYQHTPQTQKRHPKKGCLFETDGSPTRTRT